MLLSWTFSPSSIVDPDLTRLAKRSVPGNRRNKPISDKKSWPPPTYIVGDRCSTLKYKNPMLNFRAKTVGKQSEFSSSVQGVNKKVKGLALIVSSENIIQAFKIC